MSHITLIDSPEILIRSARSDDLGEITRVTGRDTGTLPAEPLLVAEVDGNIRAAVSMTDGEVVADPFHRTAELVAMLKIRASTTSVPRQPRARSRRRVPALRSAG